MLRHSIKKDQARFSKFFVQNEKPTATRARRTLLVGPKVLKPETKLKRVGVVAQFPITYLQAECIPLGPLQLDKLVAKFSANRLA